MRATVIVTLIPAGNCNHGCTGWSGCWLAYCAERRHPRTDPPCPHNDSWQPEFLAYFDSSGVSNRPTEAINLPIKKIKRVGRGFRNFDDYWPDFRRS